jgi:RNA polymerase primary sigma factor
VSDARQSLRFKAEDDITAGPRSSGSCDIPNRFPASEEVIQSEDERQMLSKRMGCLDERERAVLALRYGLDGIEPLTLKEIGRQLGVVREWVRKIEIRALEKLRRGGSDRSVEVKSHPSSPVRRRRSSHAAGPLMPRL